MRVEWFGVKMKNYLIKNLTAVTIIICTVGIVDVWAEERWSKSQSCIGKNTSKWDNCFGAITFPNGEKYSGEFKKGKIDGKGEYNYLDKSVYVGYFRNGKRNGKGTQGFGNGDFYDGEYKDDMINGIGTYFYINGDKYVGEWKNDEFRGQGTYTTVSGRKYVGIWDYGTGYGLSSLSAANGDKYVGEIKDNKRNGQGTYYFTNGNKYEGEWKDDEQNGIGTLYFLTNNNFKGDKYVGEFKNGKFDGKGIYTKASGIRYEGFWDDDKFISETKVDLSILNTNKITDTNNKNVENDRLKLAEERKKLEEEKRNKAQASNSQRINLQVNNTQPNSEGDFVINIQTGADTASLKINGEEFGGRADGNYTIKKVARAGQETKFTIIAKDTNGNTDSKIVAVSRLITSSNQIKYAELNPALVKSQINKDAVAIIIGIADYKNLPRADFANDDARAFYDYAIRALGVRAENIKLLVDTDAGQGEIYKAFKTWLPSRVKATTDVYVYYSGHGLPAADGQSLYLLPQLADRDLIEETAIAQSKINAALQAAKPKSVTIFLDSCYSGAGRTGATLLASARPIVIKSTAQAFPAEFTVISASTAEQISSSSNELKHGIFSYYLMRGMEGEADANKDGKITAGEMHGYLMDNVARQASLANRVQQPQLSGDANRVLVRK
jgi:hypothetical protein